MATLFEDYLAASDALASFYAIAPKQLFAAAPAAHPWAGDVAEALRREQTRLGLTRSFEGDEAVIVTGQQPGLFTGPLYTVYKAITAIQCAARVTERSGAPCVPIFWVGGEDHDFEEARTAHFLTKQHTQLSLRYEPETEIDGLPMDRVDAGDGLHAFIDEAAAAVPGSELSADVADALHAALDVSDSLSDWCARILAKLFADTPLLFFSPALPEARRAATPIIEAAIRDALATTRLLNETGERLAAAGYAAQIVKGADECAFFLYEEGRRRKVTFTGGRFQLPETGASYSEAELLALLGEAPERFSPNVALRCIVQQVLFPVAAYVAGPGEIAYWAQLEPVFAHFGQPMPVVYPRARCVLTTIKTNKILKQLGLRREELTQPRQDLLARALDHAVRSEGRTLLEAHEPGIDAASEALVQALRGSKGLAGYAEGYASRSEGALAWLREALLRADAGQAATVEAKLERVCATLAPGRTPQERVYSICSYLFQHGWGLAGRLMKEVDLTDFGVREIEL